MKKRLMVLSGLVLASAPVVIFAQASSTSTGCPGVPGTVQSVLCIIMGILNIVIPLLIVLALVYFIWGVVSYVIGTDEETKKTAREKMIYGIIGLAVIVGIWGLVGILNRTFNSTAYTTPIPCVVGTPGCP